MNRLHLFPIPKMKIQTKISSIVFIAILMTGATTITISALVSRNMIETEVYNHLEDVAASRAHNIETFVGEEMELVKVLATDYAFIEAVTTQNVASANQRIKTLISIHNHKDISRIRVLDKHGNVVASSHTHAGVDKVGNEEFLLHGKEGIYIRDIHTSMMTGTLVFSISAPILVLRQKFLGTKTVTSNGEFAGIVITDIEAKGKLYEITTDRTGLGETGEIYLINKEGYMITPSRFVDDSFLKQRVGSPEAKEWLELSEVDSEMESTEMNIYEDYRGKMVIGTHRAIEGMDWCLLAEIDVEEALAPVSRLVWLMFLFFIMLLDIGIVFALLISKTITNPIVKLLQRIQEITKGNWNHTVAADTKDEIGQLSKAFDTMTANLKKSQDALQKSHESLSSRVQERTAKLVAANDTLQREITKHKQTEKALQESERKYRDLVETSSNLIWKLDLDWQFTYLNVSWEEMLGYTVEEMLGKPFTDFKPPEQTVKDLKIVQEILETGVDLLNYETSLLTKSGQLRIVLINARVQRDIDGKICGLQGTALDITERKQAEEQLRHSEERFRKMFEDGPISMVIASPDLRLIKVNAAFCQMLGYTEPELLKLKIADISSKEDMPKNRELVKQALNGEISFYQMEKRYIRKDGQLVWGHLAVSFFHNEKGEVIYFLAMVENITEHKRAEKALKEAVDAAESANRAKSEFLANMSHEIRTPLHAVIGFSELLFSLVTDKKQKSYLNSIQTAGKSLLTLINDILDLSKIEAGRLDIQYESTNPYIIFNELKQIFALKIAEKNLEFIVEIDKELPSALILDETRLRQVLLNLIGNAIKFTEQGYIKLSAQKIYKVDDHSKLDFIISVADTCIGIPSDQQKIIFESFQQQDGQSTRKYGGTGLGLAITKRLVEMMNGQISVRSTVVGKGSIFEITLRDVKASSIEPADTPDGFFDLKNISFEKARVLVVDDIESNRNLIKECLSQVNLDVIEAENGQKALHLANEYHPALILMDIRMPEMDGVDATQQLKANPSTFNIPIIALTASVTRGEKSKLKLHSFDGYLSKPVNTHVLFNELSRYLKFTEKTTAVPVTETATVGIDTLKNLTPPEIARLSDLIGILEKDTIPRWKEINGMMEIEVIKGFAENVITLGKEYNVPSLTLYGEKLRKFVQEFDITNIEETLNEFPRIVKRMRNQVS